MVISSICINSTSNSRVHSPGVHRQDLYPCVLIKISLLLAGFPSRLFGSFAWGLHVVSQSPLVFSSPSLFFRVVAVISQYVFSFVINLSAVWLIWVRQFPRLLPQKLRQSGGRSLASFIRLARASAHFGLSDSFLSHCLPCTHEKYSQLDWYLMKDSPSALDSTDTICASRHKKSEPVVILHRLTKIMTEVK